MEIVKVFRFWIDYDNPGSDTNEAWVATKIENAINVWLLENKDKIELCRVVNSEYKCQSMVMIFYRTIEEKPKTKTEAPPVLKLNR